MAALLATSGCSLWPSSWHFGGTPEQRERTAAAKVQSAREAEIGAAQRAVHQTGAALDAVSSQLSAVSDRLSAVSDQHSAVSPATEAAGTQPGTRNSALETAALKSRAAVAAARDFNAEAQALLDQAHGAPAADQVAQWRQVVADVLAGDARARDAQSAEIATLSDQLTRAEAAHARALEAVKRNAADNAFWANLAHKLILGAIALGVLIVATHLLGFAAHLNPGSALLGTLATGAHALLASGAVLAQRTAEQGLQRVGSAVALVRQKLPAAAAEVTTYLDAATATHPTAQTHIAAGASAAGAPPPAPHTESA